MSFEIVPDAVYLRVFARLPLEDLLRSASTSKRWYDNQKVACQLRTELTIHHCPDQAKITKNLSDSELIIPYAEEFDDRQTLVLENAILQTGSNSSTIWFKQFLLSTRKARWLISKFPSIKRLNLVVKDVSISSVPAYVVLIKQWRDSLQVLKMWIGALINNTFPVTYAEMLMAIVQCKSLRHLTMDIQDEYFITDNYTNSPGNLTRLLSVIDHVEELYLQINDIKPSNEPAVWNYLTQSESKLKQIAFYHGWTIDFLPCNDNKRLQNTVKRLQNIRDTPELAKRFVQLPRESFLDKFLYNKEDRTEFQIPEGLEITKDLTEVTAYGYILAPVLKSYCKAFSNLTKLAVNVSKISSLPSFLNSISRLKKLLHLEIHHPKQSFFCHPSMVSARFRQLSQLPSVKVLEFQFYKPTSHDDLIYSCFEWTFPQLNVFKLEIDQLKCNICNTEGSNLNPECVRKMLRSILTRCGTKLKILHVSDEIREALEEEVDEEQLMEEGFHVIRPRLDVPFEGDF